MKAVGRVLAASEFSRRETIADVDEVMAVLCSRQLATRAARLLLGCYPARDLNDIEVYTLSLIKVFCEYPVGVVFALVHPVIGLPSQQPYFPTVADCSIWLRKTSEALAAKRRDAADLWLRSQPALPVPDRRQLKSEEERRQFVRQALGREVAPRATPPPVSAQATREILTPPGEEAAAIAECLHSALLKQSKP